MYAHDLGNTEEADLAAYPQTIKKLIKKIPNVRWVIPGHGLAGSRELIFHTQQLAEN